MDNELKYRLWDGKEFKCSTCGNDSMLGLETEDIHKAGESLGKVICIDCAMEFIAQVKGIKIDDLIKEEEEKSDSYDLFMDVMNGKYFRENKKKGFDSTEEERHVREFFAKCWGHYPKWFSLVPALYGKEKAREYIGAISFDFRELASIIKNSYGGKVDRNAPCPCRSGRKYKKCCGA